MAKISYPGPQSEKIISVCKQLEGSGLRTFSTEIPPITIESANGIWLKDPDGNTYLDLFAGFSVENIGHSHPRVVEAICRQAPKLLHCPPAYCNELRAKLLEKLCEIAPKGLNRILWGTTGAMANEIALNLSRSRTERKEIISFHGSYLGGSNGIIGLNGKAKARARLGIEADAHFVPFPYCYRCPFGGCDNQDECKIIDYIDDMLRNPASGVGSLAAIFVEPIQGSGGVVIPPKGFLSNLQKICQEHNALLVIDEIQVGFGRTGRMWAAEHDGVVPDLMTIGKGIGGGLPVSAVIGREELMNFWEPNTYSATFLTNPLLHSAALAAIEVMQEEKLWLNSAELGEVLLDFLSSNLVDHPLVGEVRGKGLYVGIEMVKDKKKKTPAKEEARKAQLIAREMGLFFDISGYYGNVVRIAPPLIITRSELEQAIDGLINVFKIMKKDA